MQAVVEGPSSAPYVVVTTSYEASHPETGQPLREWLADLPDRSWDPSTRAWVVTGVGEKDPDETMMRAGLDVLGPDGDLTSLTDLHTPTALPLGGGEWVLHPRLTGRTAIEARLPATATWSETRGGWILPASVLLEGGRMVDWVVADEERLIAEADMSSRRSSASLQGVGDLDSLRLIPVSQLASVGDGTARAMRAVGLATLHDLLHHAPRRYVDLSNPTLVQDAPPSSKATVIGSVRKVVPADRRGGIVKATVVDDAGTRVHCRWFNASYMARRYPVGTRVAVHAKLETFVYGHDGATGYSMSNPMTERIEDGDAGQVIGFYPASATNDLSTWALRRACLEAVQRVGDLSDPVPDSLLEARGLPGRTTAYADLHQPPSMAAATAARDRLAYDELLRLQVALATTREAAKSQPARVHPRVGGGLVDGYIASLPYRLTGAQERAINEVRSDMAAPTPMNRLLMGDVGVGKTQVCVAAMLSAVEHGQQAVLVAPTEVLATQHHADIADRLADTDVTVALLTNKATALTGQEAPRRKDVLASIASGECDVVVGTHAVFADKTAYKDLSLVVVDEQHRFGVEQRAALTAKAGTVTPDVLHATATPIPRTAALTTFGDMDTSILDEAPPGRTPVATTWLKGDPTKKQFLADKNSPAWERLRAQLADGRQGFVVVPAVDSATAEAASAYATAEALSQGALSDYRVGVITGKDKPAQRAETMRAFAAGDLAVLVATTVIEVGVNVPNATVIVVMGAERFGLAQLHQLRGRVGRGEHPGYCLLLSLATTSSARRRMEALVETSDGFVLAEEDLQMRGTGQLTGPGQSGRSEMRVANLLGDHDLLEWAKEDGRAVVGDDPDLSAHPGLRREVLDALDEQARDWLTSR